MTIVVTGAQGFIGRTLAAACRHQGIEVVGLDSTASDGTSVQADIGDAAIGDVIPEGADTVVHLAAVSRDPDCRADPQAAFAVNTVGTLNLFGAACRRNVRQFIFASTEWVYGDVRNDEVQVESQPIDSMAVRSIYALTKIAAEQSLKLTRQDTAIDVTVLRFGIVYGSRADNWSAVESLFNAVRTKDEVSAGSLGTARRFIHVDDIVTGILAARGRRGFETFNLSGDRLVTLGEVVETSARLLGRTPRVAETAPQARSVRNPDNAAIRAALNWRPTIDLEAGLRSLNTFLTSQDR